MLFISISHCPDGFGTADESLPHTPLLLFGRLEHEQPWGQSPVCRHGACGAQVTAGAVGACEAGDLQVMGCLSGPSWGLWSEPAFVWQSSLQCPLQSWGHRRVLYRAGQHPVEACNEQSLVLLCYDKSFQLLGETQPKVSAGQGFSGPCCHRSMGTHFQFRL